MALSRRLLDRKVLTRLSQSSQLSERSRGAGGTATYLLCGVLGRLGSCRRRDRSRRGGRVLRVLWWWRLYGYCCCGSRWERSGRGNVFRHLGRQAPTFIWRIHCWLAMLSVVVFWVVDTPGQMITHKGNGGCLLAAVVWVCEESGRREENGESRRTRLEGKGRWVSLALLPSQ